VLERASERERGRGGERVFVFPQLGCGGRGRTRVAIYQVGRGERGTREDERAHACFSLARKRGRERDTENLFNSKQRWWREGRARWK